MKQKNHSNLLIIDDDIDLLDLMGSFFRQRGYVVSTFNKAEEALIEIEQKRFLPEVVICDLKLPVMTGMDFIRRIRKSNSSLPIILMTSEGSVETAVEAIDCGAYDFILKPLHFPQLLICVQRALFLKEIQSENNDLKNLLREDLPGLKGIIARSEAFLKSLELARRVSDSTANILITGESGSGKEVIARAVHELGERKDGPFVALNCSAIPDTLLESELFGHAKGSFTGAYDKKVGLFEEANRGTLFLDEIGDLNLSLQAKLLRVLQERKIKRVGENQYREINARIICATHKDLRREVMNGTFREDLFFRLNVIPIHVPPLRERREDIVPLSEYFLKKFTLLNNARIKGFSNTAIEKLENYQWRGNVRELENTIERAVVLSNSEYISAEDICTDIYENFTVKSIGADSVFSSLVQDRIISLEELNKKYIEFIFNLNSKAKEQTAKDLGIDRKTLYRKLKEMNLNA